MSHRHLLVFLTLAGIVVHGAAASGSPAPQLRPLISGPVYFHSQDDLFSRIAAESQLGDPEDRKLLAQLAADSHVEHLRDSTSALTVVQVDLRNADGTSRARSPDGNYYYYVVRDTAKGLLLLGRMYGQGYESHLEDGYLQFDVKLHRGATRIISIRFRAEDSALVNLSAPPPLLATGPADA